MKKLMLSDVLDHIYPEDKITISTVDTRVGSVRKHVFGPCARQQMEWDLTNHGIDQRDTVVYRLNVLDNKIEIIVEFSPFEKWINWRNKMEI